MEPYEAEPHSAKESNEPGHKKRRGANASFFPGRRDLWLVLLLLVCAAALWIGWGLFRSANENENPRNYVAVVEQYGKEVARLPLSENGRWPFEGRDGRGKNVIVVEDGAVFMAEADCPDSLCVQMGRIYREGESIVCLPHGLVVRIEKASS